MVFAEPRRGAQFDDREACLERISEVAHRLAVVKSTRFLPPYTYLPSSRLLQSSEPSLAFTFRLLCERLELDPAALELIDHFRSQSSGALDPAAPGSTQRAECHAYQLALLAVSSDPTNHSARITAGAILLRQGQLSAAEAQFCCVERRTRSHLLKSRAIANRAVVQELYGDVISAARLCEIAVSLPIACSLAARNYQVYKKLATSIN